TAVVVGPGGEEIWCDKYGRVKVQFHWDRYGKKDENSSCWIRVANPWAGANWGGIALPRIGQEVIVDFLEGDPDQPIITGRVYNAAQMPPYELPAHATQTGIKTRSSKGDGAATLPGKPAARVTGPTTHGSPLSPGPGSPTVLIGGLPAWRTSVDEHACPATSATGPDGVGNVIIGSPRS